MRTVVSEWEVVKTAFPKESRQQRSWISEKTRKTWMLIDQLKYDDVVVQQAIQKDRRTRVETPATLTEFYLGEGKVQKCASSMPSKPTHQERK